MDRNVVLNFLDLSNVKSLSARRAWIEIGNAETAKTSIGESLSARRAWIEIVGIAFVLLVNGSLSARRAWIEIIRPRRGTGPAMSLSARRAWIEIPGRSGPRRGRDVALRKESVDRNKKLRTMKCKLKTSLSARRAWIEILTTVLH